MIDTSTEAIQRMGDGPWCYASEDISATLRALVAERDAARTAQREAEALVTAMDIELKVAIGGCDANNGNRHTPISIDGGKYYFCQFCGETMTKAAVKRHSSAAAIRKG